MAIRLSRVQRAAGSNRGATRLPPLSPAFLQEEDAAYWAHQQIGARRDREYGGVILRGAMNKYFATEPLPGDDMQFDLLKVLGLSAEGYYQQPKGYTCVASYHSHPAQHSLIQKRNLTFDARMVKAFLGFFSGSDFTNDVDDRDFFPAAYLSGPDGSLIRYAPSGSAPERSFALWIKAGKPVNNRVGVYGPFSEFVKKISTLGELSLIVPTQLWGGDRGKVPADWVVFEPFTSTKVTLPPLCTSIFTRAEEAVNAAQVEATPMPHQRTFGFVLKLAGHESYVATFPTVEGHPLFSPNGIFAQRAEYEWDLPPNYDLEGIYYRCVASAADASAHEPWLYSNFVTPAEVLAAITQARATQTVQDNRRGLHLYAQVLDGALLKIKVPQVSTAGGLVNQSRDGVLDDNGMQEALKAGTLRPRDYLRKLIAATDVSVVQPGQMWRDLGRVDKRSALLTASYAKLSDSFLSANDAALHAHEQIGNRRDLYYGGYVLKATDGRFAITLPLEGTANPFDGQFFFLAGNQGPLFPPELYEVHGRYGSHPALSMVDPAWVERRRWARDDAMINLQMFSPPQIQSIIQAQQVAYLSGAQDCLLAYSPTATSTVPVFDSATGTPTQWVRLLAESGELRVVDGNPLWGTRAVIRSGWTAYSKPVPGLGRPEYTTYGAVFNSADKAARNLHTRVHGRNLATQDCFAFVLKHQHSEQYIASEVVCVDGSNELFKLNSLFAAERGGYRFPDGFVLHALFRSQQWKPTGLGIASAWLTTNFVTPAIMYRVLYDSARRGRQYSNGSNLPVYFSNLEGALLRYVPSPIEIGHGGAVELELGETEAQLATGKQAPLDFVRSWIRRGQLAVVRSSQRWDKLGAVSDTWSGYEHITRRRLSPAFASADDAARHAAALVGEGRQRQYGGVILRFANGLFAATEPLAVPPRGFTLDWIYPDQIVSLGLYPEGSTLVARYSTRVPVEIAVLLSATQKALYQSMIPSAVLSNLLHREAHIKREYVFGAHGSILSYQLSGTGREAALKNTLAARNLVRGDYADNQVEQQISAGTLLPGDFVTKIAQAGVLRVVEGNDLWGPARQIGAEFIPNAYRVEALLVRATLADPPYSPIFTRAIDAVRHVHRSYKAGAQRAFGYVLKVLNKPLYMTTMPLVRENYAKLEQVFIGGHLPQGYTLEGLYLCASDQAIAEPGDDMVYSFFGPGDIANALSFANTSVSGRVLPLYLMCADGALLRYRYTATNGLYALMNEVRSVQAQLLEGTMRVADYVRTLAAKGGLDVRVASRVWSRTGRINLQWQSQARPHSFDNDPYLHSFCSPLFGHADDAARSGQKQVAPFTDKEYLGAVLMPPGTPGYVAIDPVEDADWGIGSQSSLALLFWLGHKGFDLPRAHSLYSYTIVAVQAFYKVIPSTSSQVAMDKNLLKNFVMAQDLQRYVGVLQSNLPAGQSCYLSCRGGALLKYAPSFTTQETAVLQPSLPMTPSLLVSQLRRFGQLSVLDTDTFWTYRGALGEEWQISEVMAEPDEDAVRFGRDKDEL